MNRITGRTRVRRNKSQIKVHKLGTKQPSTLTNKYCAALKLSKVKQKLSLIFASLRGNFPEAVNLANMLL